MTYTLVEHRHRFAAWAAGRAAGAKSCRFTVEEGRQLIESTGIASYAADWKRAPETPEAFNAQHRFWREQMVARARANRVGGPNGQFTHGIAAKLINVYLKSAVVCAMSNSSLENASVMDVIHPPIDRLLLMAISEHVRLTDPSKPRSKCFWREYANRGWSSFSSDEYEDVIREIRKFSGAKPLWLVEEHWIGHRISRRSGDTADIA